MLFYANKHEMNYLWYFQKMPRDVYHRALAYLLTLDEVCCEHISEIYNFEKQEIIPDALSKAWNTSTSLKTMRLAFNLFTGHTRWSDDESPDLLSPSELFCSEYMMYYLEAIRIRYPEYVV